MNIATSTEVDKSMNSINNALIDFQETTELTGKELHETMHNLVIQHESYLPNEMYSMYWLESINAFIVIILRQV